MAVLRGARQTLDVNAGQALDAIACLKGCRMAWRVCGAGLVALFPAGVPGFRVAGVVNRASGCGMDHGRDQRYQYPRRSMRTSCLQDRYAAVRCRTQSSLEWILRRVLSRSTPGR